ncbi:MAG: Hpt domain-containing protein [Leptolyngbyaceae cyanobacterium SM1_3_5]|nr:Hpt domain-containing protein [Leptolyngbyaceae cyanobacterium SM1_3_5]
MGTLRETLQICCCQIAYAPAARFLVAAYDREMTAKRNQTQAIATGMTENNHPASRPTPRAWQESTHPPNAAPSSQPPDLDALRQQIDWEHLHRLSDDSTEFEWELLQVFAEDSSAYLAHLKQAIAQEDFWQIERDAHHIKGAKRQRWCNLDSDGGGCPGTASPRQTA